ncbi:MAG: ATP-binding protein [Gemmatimonadaceae bacterium]|nr:ATP-binding protein [Gemmatimonadaceae bacterium]
MSRRVEHASTLFTSSNGFEVWCEILGDDVSAGALIDRPRMAVTS